VQSGELAGVGASIGSPEEWSNPWENIRKTRMMERDHVLCLFIVSSRGVTAPDHVGGLCDCQIGLFPGHRSTGRADRTGFKIDQERTGSKHVSSTFTISVARESPYNSGRCVSGVSLRV